VLTVDFIPQLLEDHLQQLRQEDGVELGEDDDDDAMWNGWDIDSEESDSDSDEWHNVDSDDDDDLVISDSEDEKEDKKEETTKNAESEVSAITRISTLATTKVYILFWIYSFSVCIILTKSSLHQILTPADFALLNDLRLKAAAKDVETIGGSKAKRKLAALEAAKVHQTEENEFISENDILGPRKKAKADYAERMASIQKGREGREKFGSRKGKQNKAAPSSSTNREKARNKPIMMVLSSSAVRGKKKASLRDKQQKLRAHITKAKKAGH